MLSKKGLLGGGLYIGIVIATSISNVVAAGIADKRNELNQIYWRIQANNRINDPELEEEHEWIKQDRYWESIVKVIGKAIGDCVTGQGVFANKKADDVITFEGTNPERYERRHWNAEVLCNFVWTYYFSVCNDIDVFDDDDVLDDIHKKILYHYTKCYMANNFNFEDKLQKLQQDIKNAVSDVARYVKALTLGITLESVIFDKARDYNTSTSLNDMCHGNITHNAITFDEDIRLSGTGTSIPPISLKWDNSALEVRADSYDSYCTSCDVFGRNACSHDYFKKYLNDLFDGLVVPLI